MKKHYVILMSLHVSLAAIIVLISGASTIAQSLHQDWTRTETGINHKFAEYDRP